MNRPRLCGPMRTTYSPNILCDALDRAYLELRAAGEDLRLD